MIEQIQLEVTKKLLHINTIKVQPNNPFTWAFGLESPDILRQPKNSFLPGRADFHL